MLIFTTDPNSSIKLEEQVTEAIQAGCGWIQLRLPSDASPEEKENLAESVTGICRHYDMILTLENETDIVEKLKVHGIHLDESHTPQAIEIRRQLGPHAIIGVTSSSADSVKRLYDLADIDYALLPQSTGLKDSETVVSEIAKKNLNIPVVIATQIVPDIEMCSAIFRSGVRGIMLDAPVAQKENIGKNIAYALNAIDAALKN